jgi:phage terminase large subunit-like protein
MTTAQAPTPPDEIVLHLPRPHAAQQQIIAEAQRFNVVCCGRRWGKSTLGLNRLLEPALAGGPVAYFAPTYKNLTEFWREAVRVLGPVTARANAAEHRLDLLTGGVLDMWSLDSPEVARGRRYRRVVLDEVAMVKELARAWDQVIRSTLADYSGDAWFMSTPKGFNDYHILYTLGQRDEYPDWASWQMPTSTNPHISPAELESLERDLPSRVFRQEILAQFEAENEGALWSREWIDRDRIPSGTQPELRRVVVALDPSGSRRGDEVGIVVCGIDARPQAYVLADLSAHLGPDDWAARAITAYEAHQADAIVAEANFGGEMVKSTIAAAAREMGSRPHIKLVQASRGKVVRAEPCSVLAMQGKVHHVGHLPELENELTSWTPLDSYSPGRLDALVWALTELMLDGGGLPFSWLRSDEGFRQSVLGSGTGAQR